MSNFSLLQRYNSLITAIDRITILLKTSTPQPINIPLIISNSSLTINFHSIPCSTFSVNMSSDLTNITFQNAVINGFYTIYIYGSGQIIKKQLGSNIKNNLNGDIRINGMFIVNVHYDGINFMMRFTNYT